MSSVLEYRLLVLTMFPLLFWLAAWFGGKMGIGARRMDDEDFSLVLGGSLTLLGLIIGFTFSMAVGRYDQRKNYEEQEANAVGTEYLRADLLPAADAARVRELLRSYLDQRILFYTSRDAEKLRQIDRQTARLQADLWSTAVRCASVQTTPVAALVVSGMNDVLNSQGYTQAAWWNTIPIGAWALLVSIAIFCNLLIGYGAHTKNLAQFLVLPITLSVTLFLIADIDSPRGGLVRVLPMDLQSVAQSIAAP